MTLKSRVMLVLVGLAVTAPVAFAIMTTLRAPGQTALTASANSAEATVDRSRSASVFINVTQLSLDGDDEVDFYVQTTFDGVSWCDRANIHFAAADNGTTPKWHVMLTTNPGSGDDQTLCQDGAIADDTDVAMQLGSKLRIKVTASGTTAPTFNYQANVFQ